MSRIDPFARRKRSASVASSMGGSNGETVLPLRDVYTHRDLQFREQMSDATYVEELAELLRDDESFNLDAIECVLVDGTTHYVVNGHQRRAAYAAAGRSTIPVVATAGDWQYARWRAITANNKSQLALSNAEKRTKVVAALREFGDRSDRELATAAGVSPRTVGNWRKKLVGSGDIPPVTERVGRDGRTINTASIGRSFVASSASATYTEDEPPAPQQAAPAPKPRSASPTPTGRTTYVAPPLVQEIDEELDDAPTADAVDEWLNGEERTFVRKSLLIRAIDALRNTGHDELARELTVDLHVERYA